MGLGEQKENGECRKGPFALLAKDDLAYPYLMLAFVLSRILYFGAGIRFDTQCVGVCWQFLDPFLLRNDLAESIYYLHGQPPLFNFFLGCVLKLFPHSYPLAFHVFYLGLGLTLTFSLYALMRRFGVAAWLSSALTILFIVSPACILYENWLFYTYPLAAFLSVAALLWHSYVRNWCSRDGVALFTLLAVVVLTRSLFHIVWFLCLWALLIFLGVGRRRKVVLAALVPFLVAVGWYLKNQLVFGTFAASSWVGLTLADKVLTAIPHQQREKLVDQRVLSRLSLIPPFGPVGDYGGYVAEMRPTGIASLDQELKSTGSVNYHHRVYIALSKQYLWESVRAILARPGAYLRTVLQGIVIYLKPANRYYLLDRNRNHIRRIERYYDALVYWRTDGPEGVGTLLRTGRLWLALLRVGLLLPVAVPGLAAWGIWLAAKALARPQRQIPLGMTVMFLATNIIYVTVLVNLVEPMENNRMRFMIDPLALALLALFLDGAVKQVKATRRIHNFRGTLWRR